MDDRHRWWSQVAKPKGRIYGHLKTCKWYNFLKFCFDAKASIVNIKQSTTISLNEGHTQYPWMSTDSQVSCPYCESKFKDKNELSKHIDRIHSDSGLLEGDKRQW